MKDNLVKQLAAFGQSIWLDYIRRTLIVSGELRRLIEEDGLRGMTSNPAIFEKAIAESHDYDEDIRAMALEGKGAEAIYETLSQRDVQSAADEFRPLSANRTVREYTEQHYLPAATAYRERAANKGAVGRQVVDWQHAVDQQWGSLRFGDLRVETNADHRVFEVEICLSDFDPDAVRVELYADGIDGGDPVREEMKFAQPLLDASRRCVYRATIPTTRPPRDYTARVIPQRSGVAVPLESARILWQR